MKADEKQLSYTTVNTYSTLNELTDHTKYVWVVLHGIGYLSRYFLKYFDALPKEEHYIIAPQAPSKYYLNEEYKHVGASWLTKEQTAQETENVISYLDAVLEKEGMPSDKELIIFGFSQGVSIASRWVAQRRIPCQKLVLYAGSIPNELTASDFDFLNEYGTEVLTIVGNQDEYLTKERREIETTKIHELFNGKAKQLYFEGRHEVKKEIINNIVFGRHSSKKRDYEK